MPITLKAFVMLLCLFWTADGEGHALVKAEASMEQCQKDKVDTQAKAAKFADQAGVVEFQIGCVPALPKTGEVQAEQK